MELQIRHSKVFTQNAEAFSNDNVRFIINQGGSRCFAPTQLIYTTDGDKPISEIKEGDIVKTLNIKTKEIEYKSVNEVFKSDNVKKSLRIKLKNGSIIECTEDHEFYFEGGFTSIRNIVSLLNGKMDKNTRL